MSDAVDAAGAHDIKSAIRSRAQGAPLVNAQTTVVAVEELTPTFTRVVVQSDDLAEYVPRPADAVKLLLTPDGGAAELPHRGDDGLPAWQDGAERPVLRALTVRSFDAVDRRLTLDIARHSTGVLTRLLERIRPGDRIDMAGMRPEWHLPEEVRDVVLVADVTGLPAVAAIVENLDPEVSGVLYLGTARPADADLVAPHPGITTRVVADLADVAAEPPASVEAGRRTQVWIAAEAAHVRRLRRIALQDWQIASGDLLARAYWKAGRDSTEVDAENLVRYRDAIADGADLHDPQVAEDIDLGV
ncbi:siderophore-interacting protein [Gordonia soli]|uniref:Putative siderophore-interacting protein n=1 Tax=Gordonia soli NBRC 108243 TaxID=1223545 RepID=M0QHC5_9ACTN|nr:siderophore-interacting protein [Gordonia soli]GAC67829.1 putative siderophore-interacting protein [Gordonia soli NBRC 108243]